MKKSSCFYSLITVFVLLFCFKSYYVSAENIDDAIASANRRLSYTSYSKYGLIDALVTFDHYSWETAENAVNSLNVDWNNNAISAAKNKLQYSSYSKTGLIESLISFDKFERTEAENAVNSLNIDWKEQAVDAAKNKMQYSSYSKTGLIESLISFDKFDRTEAEYAVNSLNIDWKEQAVEAAKNKMQYSSYSQSKLIDTLISFDKFNREEAEYAANKIYTNSTEQAVSAAKDKMKYSSYSKKGLIDSLVTFDKFSRDESEEAVNSLDVNWNQQAVGKAEDILRYQNLSDTGLLNRLITDGFTQEEAEYAVSYITSSQNTENNKNSEEYRAIDKAKSYIRYDYSKQTVIDKLIKDGFSEAIAIYAADNCDVDWNTQAVNKAQSYLKYDYSRNKIYDKLLSDQFTENQAQYAVENCDADWNLIAVNKAQSYLKYDYSFPKVYSKLLGDGFTEEQSLYGTENCGANWNRVAYNKALSYVKYNYSNEKIYNKLLSDGFDDEQAAIAVYCLENVTCDESNIVSVADDLKAAKAVYDGIIPETAETAELAAENENPVSEVQSDFGDEILSETENNDNNVGLERSVRTTADLDASQDTKLSNLWEINRTDTGVRISSTDDCNFSIHLVEINNDESLQSDQNLMINISINQQEIMIFLLILDEENNTYNAFPMNKTDINCFVTSDTNALIPSTSDTDKWNSAVALGGTVIIGDENNNEFIKGLQAGYLNIVLLYIDKESGIGVMGSAELVDFEGFENAG